MNGSRVFLRGHYGAGNFGDDALMQAALFLLSRCFSPDRIFIGSHGGSYLPKMAGSSHIVTSEDLNPSRDWLVYGGGTQFYSFALSALAAHPSFSRKAWEAIRTPGKVIRYLSYKRRARRLRPEFFRRKAALGLGLGPFVVGSSEELETRRLLSMLDFVALRDSVSMSICGDWGIQTPVLGSDLCFMPGLWDLKPERMEARRPQRGSIGAIVRDWSHTAEGAGYIEPFIEGVRRLRSQGYAVRYILFSGNDTIWNEILEKQGEHCLRWDPDRSAVKSFLGELAEFDCFFTARYHGVVFANLLGKPAVAIEVEPKLRIAAETLSPAHRLWTFPFEPTRCSELVEEIFQNYTEAVEETVRATAAQQALANNMAEEFLAFVRNEA
jgi:polysaccharide pyruvyl transferase WcaK-like protein